MSSGEAETINTAAWILAVAERPTLRAPALALRLMDALMTRDEAAAANPAYLDTSDGRAFVVYGGGHIWSLEVDPATGLPLGDDRWNRQPPLSARASAAS